MVSTTFGSEGTFNSLSGLGNGAGTDTGGAGGAGGSGYALI